MNQPIPGPPRQKMIVYIDGFNLYHSLHGAFGRSMLWLDLVQLSRSFRPNQQLVKVRYFTADVLGDSRAQGRQAHYINALEALYPQTIEVVRGRYQSKTMCCRGCGASWPTYEEKETDVNIAVGVVTDAALHNMDTAIVVSGDSDLVPGIRAARQLRPGLFAAAAFPPGRVSAHLRTLMPSSFPIGKNKIRKFQLPSTFTAQGRTFTRPPKWT